ncbi:ATP-binding protein [Candidatus Uabimicrobium amorphum]|uniref:ATP-dependent zinc metalloprotease FtsH n=1 Tax=Uabimicrobium amorphum TaxID=2596890 RepID=A0A5S9F4N5_UABAM|nr:ATP-binding protein [Candidatus Uabimicrobium amorphum]BBM85987.1 ATP-dependent zinc metalloprotease FtsH [Candidatus Uabimicrobium amorphum]
MDLKLSPTQAKCFQNLEKAMDIGNIVVLRGQSGLGKTTLLQVLQKKISGTFIGTPDLLCLQKEKNHLSLPQILDELCTIAFEESNIVLIDDLLSLYDRQSNEFWELILQLICSKAMSMSKKIIFSHTGIATSLVHKRCMYIELEDFQVEDYQFFGEVFFKKHTLDMSKVYQFVPRLNVYQMKMAGQAFHSQEDVHNDDVIDYLLEHHNVNNVFIENVEKVHLEEIKGLDDVLQTLETHVILPLESPLAAELNLKHKKGVLLYGPPGTGKTSIGRVLAHRLKSKFFSVDGRFASNDREFYLQVCKVFEAAKKNAPSIVFIDEADTCWSYGNLYRYLLTELDGIEGARSGTVCIIMTAMDVSNIPPALVRSGRVELWLELELPDEKTRREILEHCIQQHGDFFHDVDLKLLGRNSEGFSGADLRRITDDVKNFYAYDKAHDNETLSVNEYFLKAIKVVKHNKQKQEQAAGNANNNQTAYNSLFSFFEWMNQLPKK